MNTFSQTKSNNNSGALSPEEYIYKSMLLPTPTSSKPSSNRSVISTTSRSSLDTTNSNNINSKGPFLSMDFLSPDDDISFMTLHQGDSKRSITSSDFVKDAFLSDADLETTTSLSRGPSARQLMSNKKRDLPMVELTAKLERITTGDDILGENIRMSSSEWLADFPADVNLGAMPQSLFYDTPVPAASNPTNQRTQARDETNVYKHESPVLSSSLVVDNLRKSDSTPPLPQLSSSLTKSEDDDSSYEEQRTKKTSTKKTSISSTSKTKKRRKRVIDESKVCEPTPDDVLFGRGGKTNTHPGNIRFRQHALELRSWYEQSSKEEKQRISELLVEGVKSEGHRFLERGSDGDWHEVIGNGARKKASQALREKVKGRGKSKSAVSSSITSANSQNSDEDVNAVGN
eukprot:g10061.t1 g10061   contig4:1148015-1149256(+)